MNATFKEVAALILTVGALAAVVGLKLTDTDIPAELAAVPGVGVGYLFGTTSNPDAAKARERLNT